MSAACPTGDSSSHRFVQDSRFVGKFFGLESRFISCAKLLGGASSSGDKVHYLAAGSSSAHPVIMLHGNPTWSFYYRNLARDLGAFCYALAPDFLGCGLSSRTAPRTYAERVDEVAYFVDSLGLEKFSLILHDWGGAIGALYACRYPERVSSITFQNTTLGELKSLPWIIRFANMAKPCSAFLEFTNEFVGYATSYGIHHPLAENVKSGYKFPYQSREYRRAVRDFVMDIPTRLDHPSYQAFLELRDNIKNLRQIPIQVVWGELDPCFHMGIYSSVVEAVAPKSTRVFETASHLLLEDCPGEVGEEITNFLVNNVPQLNDSCNYKVKDMATPAYEAKQFKTIYDRVISQDAKKPALIVEGDGYNSLTYGDLVAQINKFQRGFVDLGLRSRDKVLFLIPPDEKLFALALAVIGLGAIPVFVDPGMTLPNLKICFERLRADAIIYGGKALLLRALFADIFKSVKFKVNTTKFHLSFFGTHIKLFDKYSPKALPEQGHRLSPDDTCIIGHTSGATGIPKGVEITYRALDTTVDIFHNDLIKDSNNINLTLLPIFALFDLANGNTSILPKFDSAKPLESLNPQTIHKVMHELEVQSAFGSGMLWLKLASYMREHKLNLSKLRNLFLIGAPVDYSTLRALEEVFPDAIISTPYGATECLPAANINSDEIWIRTDRSVSGELGVAVGSVTRSTTRVKIFKHENIDDKLECKDGEIGEIWLSGPQVSKSYHNNPEANKASKWLDKSGTTWHRSGDVGYLIGSSIYYCGRLNHAIKANSRFYYSKCVERVCNEHPDIYRSALVYIGSRAKGYDLANHSLDEIGVMIEVRGVDVSDREVRERIKAELRDMCNRDVGAQGIAKFFFHPSFPVDTRHNAKIFRCKLGVIAKELEAKGLDRKK